MNEIMKMITEAVAANLANQPIKVSAEEIDALARLARSRRERFEDVISCEGETALGPRRARIVRRLTIWHGDGPRAYGRADWNRGVFRFEAILEESNTKLVQGIDY